MPLPPFFQTAVKRALKRTGHGAMVHTWGGGRGVLVFSRDADLAVSEKKLLKTGEPGESHDAAARLSIVKVEVPQLSEVLNAGQAAAHLGVDEIEAL